MHDSSAVSSHGETREAAEHKRSKLLFLGLPILLIVAVVGSLFVGAGDIKPSAIVGALFGDGTDARASATLLYVRFPRAVLAALIGAALGIAGMLMQTITRNPLASPQTLGVNATAALAMVITIVVGGPLSGTVYPAFIGAAVGGIIVAGLAMGPARGVVALALAGMAVHLLCTALIDGFAVLNDAAVDVIFWLNGSLAGAQWSEVRLALPGIVLAFICMWFFRKQFAVMRLGPEVASALGQHYGLMSFGASMIVVLLAGSSVAVAGPIGFIGLIVPHLVRMLRGRVGPGQVALCGLAGASLLVLADMLSRVVFWPQETPVGAVTALVGAPVFLVIARRSLRERS